jgi:quinol monooxygenase YgiN
MSSAVVVIAQLEAKPAFSTEFRAALTPLIAATVQEPGCQLHQS